MTIVFDDAPSLDSRNFVRPVSVISLRRQPVRISPAVDGNEALPNAPMFRRSEGSLITEIFDI
jgi:hypothetical protein